MISSLLRPGLRGTHGAAHAGSAGQPGPRRERLLPLPGRGSAPAAGRPHHPYAVFVNCESGRSAAVVANYDEHEPITMHVSLDVGGSLGCYRLVDDAQWRPVTASGMTPPAQSAAVLAD